MSAVNTAVPKHGVGMVSPENIRRTGSASCFGRLAIIGSQLAEEGIPTESMSWLISLNHGVRSTPRWHKAKYHLGHAFLTVFDERPRVVDCLSQAFLRKRQSLSWDPALEKQTLPVIDYVVLDEVAKPWVGRGQQGPPLRSIEYARVWALRAAFSHHSFEEGMAYYQKEHPGLRADGLFTPADYAQLYTELTRSATVAA